MDKEFRGFIVEKVLNVEQTKSVIAKANLVEGDIPYVTRTVSDNGYMGTCGNIDKVNKGNCITIGAETGVAFYQPVDFVAGNKVYRLSADGLNEKHYLFLAGALNRLTKNYSYSNARIPEKIKKEIILLPIKVDKNGNPIIDDTHFYHEEGFVPDFDYMQERIEELEQERIEELEQYLVATGLNDYELTDEDIETLSLSGFRHYEERDSEDAVKVCKEMREFRCGDLFVSQTGDTDLQQKDINGKGTIFINSGVENNGIKGMTDRPAKIFPSNTISIDFWGNAYYRDFEYKMATHNHVFSLSGDCIKNEYVGLYIVSKMDYMKNLFSYSNMGTWNKIKKLFVLLPIQTDANNNPIIETTKKYHPDGYIPDWDFMEKYIKAIEKIVIADVVQYKDAMISKTKAVVA